jgi:hypothetical protein
VYACHECEQIINQASEVCPYCGADLTTPIGDATGAPAKKPKLLKVVFLWAIVLGCLWAIAWFALPWRMAGSKPGAELRARDALASIQQYLAAYQSSEGGYPASLEPLGDPARQAAQSAQSARYTLQYTAGNPGASGHIGSYALVARAGNFGYLNFYVDQTGVTRATSEDRPATAQDAPLKLIP